MSDVGEIENQNVDIPDLLQHSEPSAELYEGLISYTPSQNLSAYQLSYFTRCFLTAIRNMVSEFLIIKFYLRGFDVSASFIGFR